MSFGLGKGFDALIPTDLVDEDFDPTAEEDAKAGKLVEISITKIVRDEGQPRKEFNAEALELLADSIKTHGVLQPIVVVREGDKYKIVAGERRWRAAQMAGLAKMPAIVRTLDAQNQLELSIVENAQREDLNAIELATAYAKLKTQFNLSAQQIAERVGKSTASITNTLRLLNLPEEAKKAMLEHNLREGPMRPLVAAEPELVKEVLPRMIAEDWSARQVENYIALHKKKSSTQVVATHEYLQREEDLSAKYGARVKVQGRTVKISCRTKEDLKALLERL